MDGWMDGWVEVAGRVDAFTAGFDAFSGRVNIVPESFLAASFWDRQDPVLNPLAADATMRMRTLMRLTSRTHGGGLLSLSVMCVPYRGLLSGIVYFFTGRRDVHGSGG